MVTAGMKRFATVQFGRIHWIFAGIERPDFAPYIQVEDISDFPDAAEGDFWDEDKRCPVKLKMELDLPDTFIDIDRLATDAELAANYVLVQSIGKELCAGIVGKSSDYKWGQAKLTNEKGHYVDLDTRNADSILGVEEFEWFPRVSSVLWSMIADYQEAFKLRLFSLERPQLARYTEGGFFKPHLDGLGRKLTMVLYLNDDYDGGELVLQRIKAKIKPKAGTLIAFPSSYVHASTPITRGTKLAVVSWAR